ncbi:MAG: hypothetical protein A2X28_02815 [Elusimicrobia bacterium GWA2_56_46]|nr:MAG: hypothetical protein A2X28_02815 [Elusimicrobia bacterium GWA2_56_46]OGR55310.1 MAG: hypothetical protein A2X39_00150 [Elusimicrobia bacterium GWC2_56_31]HBW22537.1 hypothetical protein [Elusimicrobiota bacterium]
MSNNTEEQETAVAGLPAEVQEQVKNLVMLVATQQQEIALLRSQLAGFMSVGGPQPSQLAQAFSKASRNTFGKDDATEAVANLKEELQKRDQWVSAVVKSFRFAKEVVTILK